MQFIRLGVFDFFGRIIPGVFCLTLILLSTNYQNFEQLLHRISSLSISSLIIFIIFLYIFGFVLDTIGSYYQSFIGKLLFGDVKTKVIEKFKKENPDLKIEGYNIQFLDSHTEINSPRINEREDSFRAMGLMSRNLSLSIIIYALIAIVNGILNFENNNLFLIIIKVLSSFFLSYLLLLRSIQIRQSGDEYLLYSYYINNKSLSKNSSDMGNSKG